MSEKLTQQTIDIMNARFHHDSLISVATVEDGKPYVRTVDGYYEDGAFYTVTYSLSNKMRQIAKNPDVAICGEWFTARGNGENLGYVRDPKNEEMMKKVRAAFAAWYDNGHTNEDDPNTCLLCIHLIDGVLCADGVRYEIDFTK